MDDEFQEFEGEGIDVDHEFDAPRFCDFTQSETYWEAEEAEQVPFCRKLFSFTWGKATSTEIVNGSTLYGDGKSSNVIDDDSAHCVEPEILEAPSVPFLKKRTQQPEFHVFPLKAGGIIGCNSIPNCETRDLRRPNSIDASRQQKCRVVNKLRRSTDDKRPSRKGERGVFQNIRQEDLFSVELKFKNDKKFPNEPPTELFSKLSLASEPKQTTKYQLKELPVLQGLMENRLGSLVCQEF